MQDSTFRNCTNCGCKKNADVGCNLSTGNIHKTGDSMAKKLVTLNRVEHKTFVSYRSLSEIFGFSALDAFYDALYRVFNQSPAVASLYFNSLLEDTDTNEVWLDASACLYLKKFLSMPATQVETFELLLTALRANEALEAA